MRRFASTSLGSLAASAALVALVALALLTLMPALTATAQDEESAPRAARSVHLWYEAPDSTLFYNEMTVRESVPGSYFMACGFRHGYFGIQEIRSPEDKVVIFSVWEPGDQQNPDDADLEQRTRPLYEGEGVNVSRFGNEGTGGKSMFPYNWNIGETYRFLVQVVVDGEWTQYTGWFYLNEEQRWKKLVTFQALTGGDYLKGYYSFVEDFRRNRVSATQVRRAEYGNGWVRGLDGRWVSLTRATFTADQTPTLNINAGLAGDGADRFFLVTGGETANTLPLRSSILRPPAALDLPAEALATAVK